MKTSFSKMTNHRLPEYQIITSIIESDECNKFVEKRALTNEAFAHLERISRIYQLYKETIVSPKVTLATILESNRACLMFDYVEGTTLDAQLCSFLLNADKESFGRTIKDYYKFLNTSFTYQEKFEPTKLFIDFFGEEIDLEDLKSFSVSNIDLNFDNIVYDNKKQTYKIYDLEWIFDFSIPINFIFWRAIFFFSIRHSDIFSEADSITLLEQYDIKQKEILLFKSMETVFGNTVHKNHANFIDSYLKPNKNIIIENQHLASINQHLALKLNELYNTKLWKFKYFFIYTFKYLRLPKYLRRQIQIIAKSGLFDRGYYFAQNLDVLSSNTDPLIHFIKYGWKEGRNPSINFDLSHYLNTYPDVKNSKMNPLLHYILFGKKEKRTCKMDNSIFTEINCFSHKPIISILMPVYNTKLEFLIQAIESVKNQLYPNWELCIVDDASTHSDIRTYLESIQNNNKIKIKFLEKNLNISEASNEALRLAQGDYIALLDHDDELTPDALYEVVKIINKTGAEFIYSDEDRIVNGDYGYGHFKPDYSPDMLLSYNYICHLCVVKSSIIEEVGGFTPGLEGAQDYDLVLKIVEYTQNIHHIPKILYHWRDNPTSFSNTDNSKVASHDARTKALKMATARRGLDASVEDGLREFLHRIRYNIINKPLISIIIPFKDKPVLLEKCITSILKKTQYSNFEIIGISNNSSNKKTFKLMDFFSKQDSRVHFFEYNIPFNYSKLNNFAVNKYSKGDHILLLNNDTEIISENWIQSLLEHSQRKEVGAVGGLLLYPKNKIQHSGIIIGSKCIVNYWHRGMKAEHTGYYGRPHCIQNLCAITGACLMVKKSLYLEIGGLEEENLPFAFNDVDFCLRLREKGYLNVYTPYCKLYHHEMVSRGKPKTNKEIQQRKTEADYIRKRHAETLKTGDPYYNPNL